MKFPPFKISEAGVNPEKVPKKGLSNGLKIPVIGLGTFGSDHVDAETVALTVFRAAEVGYRHFDCAAVYGNEKEIGFALKAIQDGGLKREDLWITSKVWNNKHDDVIGACKKTLSDLQLDYLDLYLVHWPFPNHHPPGAPPDYHSPDAKPYIHENYMKTWRQMEKLLEMGLVKSIGTSNMTIPKMKLLLRDATIKPVCNQMELHPHFQQPELFKFLLENKIQPVGFSPIGSPGRPERDRTAEDSVPTQDPVIVEIAKRLNISPAEVCIKWAIQRGQIPIPFSVNHYLENLKCVITEPLTPEDMKKIESIDRNCRLIKGQVFLWRKGQSWEDLWDINGTIPQ